MNKPHELKIITFLFLILIFNNLSYSQENYISGFIIKNNYDTVNGFIDYRNWIKNPEKIDFRIGTKTATVSYLPTDIKEFKVENEIYVSGIVEIETTSLLDSELELNLQSKITIDTVFLQTLIKGEKGLYYYKNYDGRGNFYVSNGSGFELLVYKKYLKPNINENLVTEYNKYKIQLASYLSDYYIVHFKLKDTKYNKKELTKLFQEYYTFSSSEVEFKRKRDKILAEFGLLAGGSYTNLKFSSWSKMFDFVTESNYEPSIDFSAGAAINFVLPWYQRKFSIDNDLLYSTYNFENRREDITNEDIYSITTTRFSYSYLKINIMPSFKYPVNNVFFFFKAGISNGFAISETNHKKTEYTVYSVSSVSENTALTYTRKHESSLVFGTGIKYKKISFEARYERGNGMSDIINLVSKTNRYYLLLGYRFK